MPAEFLPILSCPTFPCRHRLLSFPTFPSIPSPPSAVNIRKGSKSPLRGSLFLPSSHSPKGRGGRGPPFTPLPKNFQKLFSPREARKWMSRTRPQTRSAENQQHYFGNVRFSLWLLFAPRIFSFGGIRRGRETGQSRSNRRWRRFPSPYDLSNAVPSSRCTSTYVREPTRGPSLEYQRTHG